MGMLAGVTDCRRNQKWGAEEDWCWDLNLGVAAIRGENHEVLAEWKPRGFGEGGRTTQL